MRMGQGVRTGLGHGGITCVLQTQFSSLQYKALGAVLYKWLYLGTGMAQIRLRIFAI